jgi:DNA-binding response OmpR family regulator
MSRMAVLSRVMRGLSIKGKLIWLSMCTTTSYLILLTGKAQRADIVAGLDAGADDYLVKPFDPEELRARQRRHAPHRFAAAPRGARRRARRRARERSAAERPAAHLQLLQGDP